jgi:acetyl esterase/lipase
MKLKLTFIWLLFFVTVAKAQQKVIQLYQGAAPGSENWTWTEGETYNKEADLKIVYNVVHPSMEVFLPDPSIATGTAVIICPGGAFQILSINSEGNEVAKWLNQHGIAAFVLRYRLGQSLTDDPLKEMTNMVKKDFKQFEQKISKVIPLGVADARQALTYVREHAAEYGLSPSRIGIMGFSAGGTLAASSAYKYTPANRPDFVAPIYPYFPPKLQSAIPADAPPLFITTATDDDLNLAPQNAELYTKWVTAKQSAELHLYAKGGHGFGMRKQNLPSDTWIERFNDWLGLNGFLKPIDPKAKSPREKEEQAGNNHKKYDEQLRKDWANIKRYAADNSKVSESAANAKGVVYMGDSITDFWINNDPAFFAGKSYYDRGISGQTTTQMLVRFRDDVINLKPAVVVILAGINDIAENNGPIKLEAVFGNIQSMALLAKAAGIKVVLSSVLPAFDFPWRPGMEPAPKVVYLNSLIKDFTDKNTIVFLDYF